MHFIGHCRLLLTFQKNPGVIFRQADISDENGPVLSRT
jgi:hypothetical protein